MKVRGGIKPETFALNPYPAREGYSEARFTENAKWIEEAEEWIYDEYILILKSYPNLYNDIETDLEHWIDMARTEDLAKRPVDDKLAELRAIIEDALCEIDESNEERIAAIEDALCELDKEETE